MPLVAAFGEAAAASATPAVQGRGAVVLPVFYQGHRPLLVDLGRAAMHGGRVAPLGVALGHGADGVAQQALHWPTSWCGYAASAVPRRWKTMRCVRLPED